MTETTATSTSGIGPPTGDTTQRWWDAPTPPGPLQAQVVVPGSKSQTNRLLVLAALADSPSVIHGALRSRDTDLMIAALRQLGAGIATEGAGLRVLPISGLGRDPASPLRSAQDDERGSSAQDDEGGSSAHDDWKGNSGPHGAREKSGQDKEGVNSAQDDEVREIEVGLAGTVMRFVPPVAALVGGRIRFDGDDGARVRPMKGLLEALQTLGVRIEYEGEEGFLPFIVENYGPIVGGEIPIDASATSQFISGLLLAAPHFTIGLRLKPIGPVPSRPHLDMTVSALTERGVTASSEDLNGCNGTSAYEDLALVSRRRHGGSSTDGDYCGSSTDGSCCGPSTDGSYWVVEAGPIRGGEMWVEPDLSNAAPFLAAALAAGGTVTVPGWPTATTQPGALVPQLLERMGGKIKHDDGHLSVTGTGHLRGLEVDLSAAGELAPTFAALAALAAIPTADAPEGYYSRFTGIGHLRGHETDRIAALVTEINRLGGEARELPDGLEILPGRLHGGSWRTYDDHRMATAGAIIGLRIPGVKVENIETTAKTLPDFPQMWAQMLSGGAQ